MECTVFCSTWSCVLDWGDKHAEGMVSVLALAVAVWTVRVLIMQARIAREESERAREHDRKSVAPMILWTTDWKQGLVAVGRPQVAGHYELRMVNHGLGPAAVISIDIRFDDQVVAIYPSELRDRISAELGKLGAVIQRYKAWDTPPPLWLSKDSAIDIIDVDFVGTTKEDFDAVLAYLRRYSFAAKSRSIYGESAKMDSRQPITLPP